MILLTGCMSTPRPNNIENVCSIFKQYPEWYKDTKKSALKWGIPAPIQMSIIYQESSFDSEARPPERNFCGYFQGNISHPLIVTHKH